MTNSGATTDSKLRVFISYSRSDEEFAQELLAGLEFAGFEPYLDRQDIAAGEDWEARLGRLIEAADTVIFVISPDAVTSKRCAWEVERTVELKKRLLPIVWRRVEEAQVPPRLKQLNYIFFDRPLMSVPSLTNLASALKTDLSWIREHTRVGEAALRWDDRGRVEALLFRGDELIATKTWLAEPPQYAPEPTLLQHEFIKASEDAQVARTTAERRRLDEISTAQDEREAALLQAQKALRNGQRALVVAGALFVCIVVGVIGWYNQGLLKEQYQWRMVMGPLVHTVEQDRAVAAKPGLDFKECANGCPTMIVVPAGTFMMGSPAAEKDRAEDEGPQHEVKIANAFAVSRTEVTFSEWGACTAAGACSAARDNDWGRGDRPVIDAGWNDAKKYVAWLSKLTGKKYRLLSEAEWEYAARGRSSARFSFGDAEDRLGQYAWYSQNADDKTHPVAHKKANPFGLFDMHGNVWEWVEDCFVGNYTKAPTDGSKVTETPGCRRVVRGGSWDSNPRAHRSASRYGFATGLRLNSLGFRVARTLDP